MKNTVTLLLPILFPMLCGVLVGLLPALKDESRRSCRADRFHVAHERYFLL